MEARYHASVFFNARASQAAWPDHKVECRAEQKRRKESGAGGMSSGLLFEKNGAKEKMVATERAARRKAKLAAYEMRNNNELAKKQNALLEGLNNHGGDDDDFRSKAQLDNDYEYNKAMKELLQSGEGRPPKTMQEIQAAVQALDERYPAGEGSFVGSPNIIPFQKPLTIEPPD